MNKNKPLIFAGIVLLSIILIVSLITIFYNKNIRNQQASALIGGRNVASGSDHLGGDCPVMSVSCTASKSTVYVNEDVKFSAVVDTGGSDHWQECNKSKLQYTWKDFSIGTKDGITLKVYVTSSGGTTKEAVCPNVKVLPRNNSAGDHSHQCGIVLVNGYHSNQSAPPSLDFSEAVRNWIMDPSKFYTDGSIWGVGGKYNSVTVRGLIPKNVALTNNSITTLIGGIQSNSGPWLVNDEKTLFAGHSLGAVAVFNYTTYYNSTIHTRLLYDPPYGNGYKTIIPCSFDSSLYVNGSAICWASWRNIGGFLTQNWTQGQASPPDLHALFRTQPSVLNDIPIWVENNCPHLYFHKS